MLLTVDKPKQAFFTSEISHTLEAQIGNTPLLRLHKTARAYGVSDTVAVFAKAEWFNPGGSVKDRPALNIIRTAVWDGRLQPGMTILDTSSGNTGIAYAMLGAARGYKVRLVMPENVSPERIAILRAYGAELILTDAKEGIDGAISQTRQMAADDPTLFYANQYDNPANWQAHYLTTANEIWQQTNGDITHFVAGVGTSGTFTGTTRRLRELNPAIRFISVQPNGPANRIEGLKHMPTAIVPKIYDPTLADENRLIETDRAYEMAKFLARNEGIFVGVSAAAAVYTAVHVAQELSHGIVVTVLPDGGFKYLSQPFWIDD
ncbi:MAG: cysteine synthase family protein [Ardenticatenaceae bacterium]|nr:cysteine synthase family protein [Anaerolineales bacterium]MCB8921187.1 cysteine synthase family protein [Ardenticatenaceae bacterium]MCB9004259.1 cysteine synthase family protein [Ardenticatenaceae bacterium]